MQFRLILLGILYLVSAGVIIVMFKTNYNNDIKIIISLLCIILCLCVFILAALKSTANDIGITVSCIPIKFKDNSESNNEIEIYLMKTPKGKWMFPGGHVQFEDIGDLDVELKKRIEKEAGLKISILRPLEKLDELTDKKTISGLHHFTYFMNVEDEAIFNNKCGHKRHIDSTFVGEVKEIKIEKDENKFLYKLTSIELNLNDTITSKNISDKIDDVLRKEGYEDRRIFDDIPKRIEFALNTYIKYRGSDHEANP
jgi:ADP-ribose pyrophosphatase YjhB (NUDIX family)